MKISELYEHWWGKYSQAEAAWKESSELEKMHATNAAETTRTAQALTREAETLRNRLWDYVQGDIEKIAKAYHGQGRNPGVSDSGYDLVNEAFSKFVEVLPKLRHYDLSHPDAVKRLLSTATRRHFLDICFPDRRKNKTENARPNNTPANAVSLEELTIEISGGIDPQKISSPEASPEEIHAVLLEAMEVLRQAAQSPKQRETVARRLDVVRIMLFQPEIKMQEIAKILQISNAAVTLAKDTIFPKLATYIRTTHPNIAEQFGIPLDEDC